MNNSETNINLIEVTPARDVFRDELEGLLLNLRSGIIPEKQEIDVLKNAFQEYKNEERALKEKRADKHERDKRSKEINEFPENTSVLFDNVLPEDLIAELSDIYCLNDIDNVKLLKRLVLQKLIPEIHNSAYEVIIEQLMVKGYISCVSIKLMGTQQKYYMLTSKGWHMLSLNKNIMFLQTVDPSFIVPKKLSIEPRYWKKETFLQAAMLCKYYAANNVSEYIIFPCEGDEDLLLGCEIKDSYSVCYSAAALFVPDKENKEASILYKIAKADKVDQLVVLVQSEDEEKRLKIKQGLDTRTLGKLRFYNISEEYLK